MDDTILSRTGWCCCLNSCTLFTQSSADENHAAIINRGAERLITGKWYSQLLTYFSGSCGDKLSAFANETKDRGKNGISNMQLTWEAKASYT